MSQFIGRDQELAVLHDASTQPIARLLIIKGRRRIGKSRLLQEFGKRLGRVYTFSGLAPTEGVTAQDQRAEFARQLQRQLGIPGINSDDWSDLFWHLAERTKQGRILIIFDEITWMAMDDPTFLPKLKNAWDLYFKTNDQLILALCSSITSWIEKNILSSTGFLGRHSLDMTLHELPLKECLQFWGKHSDKISTREKLMMLAVTGGVPRYLEEVNPSLPAEKNIQKLCFHAEGILFKEFNKLFADLFGKRSHIYQEIVTQIVNAKATAEQIMKSLKYQRSGDIYNYLDDLIQAGFITRDYTWHIANGKPSKLSQFRLSDNYSRFYLKYILPNAMKIMSGDMQEVSLSTLPGWYSMMGLQIENLVLSNRKLIKQALGLTANDIVCDNPYFQKKTASQQGCQIDYLIQTHFNTLYVVEIKFSKNIIRADVIEEVQEKMQKISVPKNFSFRPVLIHCNEVSDTVIESGFFAKIIDLNEIIN